MMKASVMALAAAAGFVAVFTLVPSQNAVQEFSGEDHDIKIELDDAGEVSNVEIRSK